MRSLLTVSEFALRGAEAERALRRWVGETTSFHEGLGISGGLILARNLMAEIVEGDAAAIDLSLRRTMAAPHHVHFLVVDSRTIRDRAFDGWTLLYNGCSTYVAAPIAALLDEPDAFHANRLRSLMEAFVDQAPPAAEPSRVDGTPSSADGTKTSLTPIGR